MRFLLAVPVLALAFAACGDDGPRTSQTRDVAAFSQLDNDDSVDVRVHVGAPQRVQVRAGEDVIDDVRTEVRNGTLRVRFEHHGWGGGDVQVDAWTPTLAAITADGSGNVEAEGVTAEAFHVQADGSGDVEVHGRTQRVDVEVDGSGNADLAGLTARHARVKADGSGDVKVHAADRLDVSVDGSGDVRYHGEPRLTQHDDGSGDVERAN